MVRKNLLGIPIYDCTLKDLIQHLNQQIISNEKKIVYGFSVTVLGRLKEIPEFVSYWEKMDIVIADGAGIPILAKFFGIQIQEHVGLPNIAEQLIRLADENNYKVLLFGGTQEANNKATKSLIKKYPKLDICKGISGYYNHNEENKIVKRINREKPDILLIGISSPIKERFALTYKEQLNTKIIVPCGGMIDIFAGLTEREPKLIRGLPVSWLYRFFQEPNRLFKSLLVPGVKFLFLFFPILFLKHITGIERNPSIKKCLKLN